MKINFNYNGCRWNEIKKSSLGINYVTLKRNISLSKLKRNGVFCSEIDVLIENLPKKIMGRISKW